jgi:signal transduction histidine kinase
VEAEGIRAMSFVPLTYESRLKGELMLYYDRPHRFEMAELEMASAIASQVAFAVERHKGAQALEALVAERTQSLRVVIAQMEEFSYSVSHDLRSPTRAMQGYAEILLEDYGDRLGEEGRELVDRIRRSGGRMDRLIHDLLTYTRISRREMQLEPVSIAQLIREVVQQYPEMRPECAEIEVASDLPLVWAHEPSLTQVVSNLLGNAIKFVPPNRRPRIRIGFEGRGEFVRVNFVDNGIGIPPGCHARLFGMFERLHADQPYEGTGIGLAIVRKAIERMNGKVGVESDGVNGSRFWIELAAPKS